MFYYSCDILIFCTSTALIRHLHDIHSLQNLDLVMKFGSVFIKKSQAVASRFVHSKTPSKQVRKKARAL